MCSWNVFRVVFFIRAGLVWLGLAMRLYWSMRNQDIHFLNHLWGDRTYRGTENITSLASLVGAFSCLLLKMRPMPPCKERQLTIGDPQVVSGWWVVCVTKILLLSPKTHISVTQCPHTWVKSCAVLPFAFPLPSFLCWHFFKSLLLSVPNYSWVQSCTRAFIILSGCSL